MLDTNPNLLFNLARSEELTGDEVLAARHYRTCLRSDALLEKPRELAKKFLAELEQKLGQIAIVAPKGIVLTVDGATEAVPAGDAIYVRPGVHAVIARLGDTEQRSEDVKTAAGAVTTVRFFEGARVVAGPGAAAPTAAPPTEPLPAAAQFEPVPPPHHGEVRPHSFWTTTRIAGTTLTALAAASLGVGIGFGVDANSKRSDVDSLGGQQPLQSACANAASPYCSSLQSAKSSQQNDARVSTVAFAAAGALAAGAVVLFLWPSSSEHSSRSAFWLSPSLAPGSTGVVAVGRF